MRHLTKITAFIVLVLIGFIHLCLNFAGNVILRIYEQSGGGTNPPLPLPTQFCLPAVNSTALFVLTVLTFIFLIISELFMSNERHRFITQLISVVLSSVISTFCLWAFLLPMYVPRVL
jgi:hypothetical protein